MDLFFIKWKLPLVLNYSNLKLETSLNCLNLHCSNNFIIKFICIFIRVSICKIKNNKNKNLNKRNLQEQIWIQYYWKRFLVIEDWKLKMYFLNASIILYKINYLCLYIFGYNNKLKKEMIYVHIFIKNLIKNRK